MGSCFPGLEKLRGVKKKDVLRKVHKEKPRLTVVPLVETIATFSTTSNGVRYPSETPIPMQTRIRGDEAPGQAAEQAPSEHPTQMALVRRLHDGEVRASLSGVLEERCLVNPSSRAASL